MSKVVVDSPAIDQESMILQYFRDLPHRNPKKIKKLALELYNRPDTLPIQKELCRVIMQSKNPVETMESCINRIEEFASLMMEFIETGHHGMIMGGEDGELAYPVRLDTVPRWLDGSDGEKWNEEDERDIMLEAAQSYGATLSQRSVLVKVVLFPEFGFSGIPRIFEVFND